MHLLSNPSIFDGVTSVSNLGQSIIGEIFYCIGVEMAKRIKSPDD